MISPDFSVEIPEDLGRVHFVGIGGSGMSGIAKMMLQRGVPVSGSDRQANYATDDLAAAGVTIFIGHDAQHVADADTIVVTSALWPDNPELAFAREHQLTVLHRSQALAWLTRGQRLIAVAGAHGKTTSTGMLVTAMKRLGLDPSFVNGGVISELGVSADTGASDLFVIEADESDGSFLLYDPAVVLITNLDTDHLDHYGSAEAFNAAFVQFAEGATEQVVISSDDPLTVEALAEIHQPRVVRFGRSMDPDFTITEIDTSLGNVRGAFTYLGEQYQVVLQVPGEHNLINAVGVISVLVGLGAEPSDAIAAVSPFSGTKRRFDLHGVIGGVSVFDDYAHHPTEVAAVLQAARTVVGEGRIIAVQQPHLYSRTQAMADQFARVLDAFADHTVVLDVCGAREDPIPGVTGELLIPFFADQDSVSYCPDWQRAAERVAEVSAPGDYVITLGCGDVYRIIPQVLAALKQD